MSDSDVFFPDDLPRLAAEDGACPPRLAVIGYPVRHSLSPGMHQAMLDRLGMPMRYIRVEVRPGEVPEVFDRMASAGFVGCNVTVPHKEEALAACHSLSPTAQAFGVVNTVVFRADGTRHGDNTDGPGLAAAVAEAFGRPLGAGAVAVLGAGGGAGRAAAITAAMEGAPKVVLLNRTVEKLGAIAEMLRRDYPATGVVAHGLEDETKVAAALKDCALLVQATSLGLKPDDPPPLAFSCLHPELAVYDMIYNPPKTALLREARRIGAPAANGLGMLVHQGAIAFSRWFPAAPPAAETMARALAG